MLRSSRNVAVASQTLCVVMMLALAQSACDRASLGDDNVYTLYRSSVSDPAARLHVATFDADENDAYNRENCEVGAKVISGRSFCGGAILVRSRSCATYGIL